MDDSLPLVNLNYFIVKLVKDIRSRIENVVFCLEFSTCAIPHRAFCISTESNSLT